jgi:hypothetical protein
MRWRSLSDSTEGGLGSAAWPFPGCFPLLAACDCATRHMAVRTWHRHRWAETVRRA